MRNALTEVENLLMTVDSEMAFSLFHSLAEGLLGFF